jgi:hypothetical protein
MQDHSGHEPDLAGARDVIARSAQQLRRAEARYASPALIFQATPVTSVTDPELGALKHFDALLLGNSYSDATYTAILSQLQGYFAALPELRAVPLGEAKSAQVMRAEVRL